MVFLHAVCNYLDIKTFRQLQTLAKDLFTSLQGQLVKINRVIKFGMGPGPLNKWRQYLSRLQFEKSSQHHKEHKCLVTLCLLHHKVQNTWTEAKPPHSSEVRTNIPKQFKEKNCGTVWNLLHSSEAHRLYLEM